MDNGQLINLVKIIHYLGVPPSGSLPYRFRFAHALRAPPSAAFQAANAESILSLIANLDDADYFKVGSRA